ncbi:MAG: hypothetical protein M1324_04455 [Patescibacteria group bacterium]|nr:hypothetical protein [Patescibacteria group bacterium]
MNEQEIKKIFANPYYAIQIAPILAAEHETLVTKEIWIQANSKLIDEIGKEEWLKQLLDILESGGHEIK